MCFQDIIWLRKDFADVSKVFRIIFKNNLSWQFLNGAINKRYKFNTKTDTQFQKREKCPWRSVTFTKCNTPPWLPAGTRRL